MFRSREARQPGFHHLVRQREEQIAHGAGHIAVPSRHHVASMTRDDRRQALAFGDAFLGTQNSAVGAARVEAEDCARVPATSAHDLPRSRRRVNPG